MDFIDSSEDESFDYDRDSSSPYTSTDYSSSNESDEDRQDSPGREFSILEKTLTQGIRSINLVHFLNTRELGGRASRGMITSAFLLIAVLPRWSAVPEREMLMDAKKLLGRKVHRWEGDVLNFLIYQSNTMERTAAVEGGLRKDSLLYSVDQTFNIIPVTFIDIVEILLSTGANLNSEDDNGNNLLSLLVEHYSKICEDGASFFRFLIKRGYDFEKYGDEAVRALVDFDHGSGSKRVHRILRILFDSGVQLTEESKRELVPIYLQNVLHQANQHSVEILILLFELGCRVGEGLSSMEEQLDFQIARYFISTNRHYFFEHLFKMVDILLEKEAQSNDPVSNNDLEQTRFKIFNLDHVKPSCVSVIEFLKECFPRWLSNAYVRRYFPLRTNLLMAFCKKYKHEDLPDVIRFLCSSGIDVNAKDVSGKNALFYLAGNKPAYRQTIYEAAQALVQMNIDISSTSSIDGSTPLTSFFRINIKHHRCCHFKNLKSLIDSCFWNTLDMLFVGTLNNTDRHIQQGLCYALKMFIVHTRILLNGYDRLYVYLIDDIEFWDEDICDICEDCLTCVAPVPRDQALSALRRAHFDKTFEFIQRFIRPVGLANVVFSAETSNHPLYYVCKYFEGDQLIALVKMLCENGLKVTEKPFYKGMEGNVCSMDAIRILLHFNPDQAHLASQLIEIMTPYGYQPDDETQQLLSNITRSN